MNIKEEHGLLSRVANGEAEAFRAIYEQYAGPLLRFVFRFTANQEQAEEILQDIFLQLLDGKYKANDNQPLKAWLYTLAKNKSLNHLKKSKEKLDQNLVDQAIDPDSLEMHLETHWLQIRLAHATEKLPDDLKKAWCLRRSGLDNQSIADRLSIPVGTVKSRFHRLVEFLKKEFSNEI